MFSSQSSCQCLKLKPHYFRAWKLAGCASMLYGRVSFCNVVCYVPHSVFQGSVISTKICGRSFPFPSIFQSMWIKRVILRNIAQANDKNETVSTNRHNKRQLKFVAWGRTHSFARAFNYHSTPKCLATASFIHPFSEKILWKRAELEGNRSFLLSISLNEKNRVYLSLLGWLVDG